MRAAIFLILAWLGPVFASAQDSPHWLATRANESDRVVLAQLQRIDYQYRRDFPVEGRAWFRPLIQYKPPEAGERLLIVSEKGLHENECYFPRVAPWDEAPRYLLFLVADPKTETLKGHPDGCAIEILVNSDGRYAARWPQPAFGGEHGRGDSPIRERVEPMRLQGPQAVIDASDLLPHQRLRRAEQEFMQVDGTNLIPTRGIELGRIRELMQPGLRPDPEHQSESMRRLKQRLREAVEDGGS